jgi:hypothetical protein
MDSRFVAATAASASAARARCPITLEGCRKRSATTLCGRWRVMTKAIISEAAETIKIVEVRLMPPLRIIKAVSATGLVAVIAAVSAAVGAEYRVIWPQQFPTHSQMWAIPLAVLT